VSNGCRGDGEGVGSAIEVYSRRPPLSSPSNEFRNPVEVVGADENVHVGRPFEDPPALELGDAATHAEDEAGVLGLEPPQPAEGMVELLRRPLAHRTRVDEDDVGGGRLPYRLVALGLEEPRHLFGVIDVHLATEGLEEECLFLVIDQKLALIA
jgi:hypothetical protein